MFELIGGVVGVLFLYALVVSIQENKDMNNG
jgi:hypothetical protein